jgi:hypothetical protein
VAGMIVFAGNPSGEPEGCRNATTILFDELLKANVSDQCFPGF